MPLSEPQEMPAEASLGAAPPSPAAPEAPEAPKPRPWPLRASVAPLRNAKALAEIRHVRLGVRLMPTALRSNGRAVEKLEVGGLWFLDWSLEVVLMLVQFKIVKTVAIVMQSFMDCRDSDHLLREILQWRQVSLSLAEPAEAVLKLLLDAGLFWPRAASSLGPAQVGNLELNRWMVKLWRLKVLKGGNAWVMQLIAAIDVIQTPATRRVGFVKGISC